MKFDWRDTWRIKQVTHSRGFLFIRQEKRSMEPNTPYLRQTDVEAINFPLQWLLGKQFKVSAQTRNLRIYLLSFLVIILSIFSFLLGPITRLKARAHCASLKEQKNRSNHLFGSQ